MGYVVPEDQFFYEQVDWRKEYEHKHAARNRQEEVFVRGNFEQGPSPPNSVGDDY